MKKKSSARSLPKAPVGKDKLRPFSSIVLDGPDRAPSRAMLYPVGFKEADFKKPVIGVASPALKKHGISPARSASRRDLSRYPACCRRIGERIGVGGSSPPELE